LKFSQFLHYNVLLIVKKFQGNNLFFELLNKFRQQANKADSDGFLD